MTSNDSNNAASSSTPISQGLPLSGVRVLDLTVVWAGTFATSHLADLGAEVIRVESISHVASSTRSPSAHPTKEEIASLPPFIAGMKDRDPGENPWNRFPLFNSHARNKLSMTVDMTRPEGMGIFWKLAAVCDVFIENNVTETLEKLGISYERIREVNPKIIMVRMPAFGNSGPYKNFRALGVNIEGVIGHALQRGYSDTSPSSNTVVHMADAVGGTQSAFAVMAALHCRRRTGKGQLVELAQAENAMPILGQYYMDYAMNGREHTTIGNRHPTAVQGCYRCSGEDRWLNITIWTDDEWRAFCDLIGKSELADADRFATVANRHANHNEIDSIIGDWTMGQEHYAAMHQLQKAGIAAGPVMDQRDAYNDAHLKDRGAFQQASQVDTGTHLYPGAPYKLTGTPLNTRRGPVRLGEDNDYVYKTLLGVSDAEYTQLESDGHIGTRYI